MIVVTITLHSARDGHIEELGRMIVANDGTGNNVVGNYDAKVGKPGQVNSALWNSPQIEARVEGYPRSSNVWELVKRAVNAVFP